MVAFEIGKTIDEMNIKDEILTVYDGEIASYFTDFPRVDYTTTSVYFR